jgi:hypothetical protein
MTDAPLGRKTSPKQRLACLGGMFDVGWKANWQVLYSVVEKLTRQRAAPVRRCNAANAGGAHVGFPPGRPCTPSSPIIKQTNALLSPQPRARRLVASSASGRYPWYKRSTMPSGSKSHAAPRSQAGSPAHMSPKSMTPQKLPSFVSTLAGCRSAWSHVGGPLHSGAVNASSQTSRSLFGSATSPRSVASFRKCATPLLDADSDPPRPCRPAGAVSGAG